MSAAQWFVAFMAVIVGCLAVTALSYRAEQYLRGVYRSQRVAWDDDELAAQVAEDERAWAEWAAILRAVDNTPHDEPTPLFTQTVLDDIYRRTGGGAA